MISIEDMATFCKRKGFVYPSSEMYGGLAGMYDYGPYGAQMKRNLMQSWWRMHVEQRDDVVGIDGAILSPRKVWEASGHLSSLNDPVLHCSKCKAKFRADTFIEEKAKVVCDGLSVAELNSLVAEYKLTCAKCNGSFSEINDFNLMFPVHIGVDKSNVAYLRGETAQMIFTNFKLVVDNARMKVPFGIAQMGKAFRNEISPRNFLFRMREFEQMEIEYFVHPNHVNNCPFFADVADHKILVYSTAMQQEKKEAVLMTLRQAVDKNIIQTIWHAYWLAFEHQWFCSLGARPDKFRIRQHLPTEKSHYACDTWDLEYEFPFGWKELQGMANRGDYDLRQHAEHGGKEIMLFDDASGKKFIPHVVAEPSQGVDRAFLVFMYDAYLDDKERGNVVLKLHPDLAPVKFGVFPLMNKLKDEAYSLYKDLKKDFMCSFDASGSIGRRYARADELAYVYCVTYDFDSREHKVVTIRDRDSCKQIRVALEDLKDVLSDLLAGRKSFLDCGELVA